MAEKPQTSEVSASSPPLAPNSQVPAARNIQAPATVTGFDGSSLQITLHKLNGTNFHEWSQLVMLVIKGKGKVGYLTGEIVRPNIESTKYRLREAKNAIVMAWLVNSMEPKGGRTYLFYKTASEIWSVVQEIYSNLANTTQCFQVRSTIRSTKQGNNSVTEYYNILTELWQEMDLFHEITWECSANGRKYDQMVEKERIFDFLLLELCPTSQLYFYIIDHTFHWDSLSSINCYFKALCFICH